MLWCSQFMTIMQGTLWASGKISGQPGNGKLSTCEVVLGTEVGASLLWGALTFSNLAGANAWYEGLLDLEVYSPFCDPRRLGCVMLSVVGTPRHKSGTAVDITVASTTSEAHAAQAHTPGHEVSPGCAAFGGNFCPIGLTRAHSGVAGWHDTGYLGTSLQTPQCLQRFRA